MPNIAFDTETFALLSFNEYLSDWTPVGQTDFDEIQAMLNGSDSLRGFNQAIAALHGVIKAAKPALIGSFEPNDLLLVKSQNGVLSKVYGPAIFRRFDHPNALVLRIGSNEFAVEQQNDKIAVGPLQGKFRFEDVELSSGHYVRGTCILRAPKSTDGYVVGCMINQDEVADSNTIDATLDQGDPIAPFFRFPPSNRSIIKMQELGVGEWLVTSVEEGKETKYGLPYILHLAGAPSVWARGVVTSQLDCGFKLPPDKPVTLVVSHVEEVSQGYRVNCTLVMREPKSQHLLNQGNASLQPRLSAAATEMDVPF